jgi:hypothetical protein
VSTARVHNLDLTPPPVVQTIQTRSLIIGGIFAIGAIFGLITNPHEFYLAYLMSFMLWLGVALGCMALLMIVHLTGGVWGTVIRRMLEAGMKTLPLMAVLFIPLIPGIPYLYDWASPENLRHDPRLVVLTNSYLSYHWFIIRGFIYFGVFLFLAYLLNRVSREQDLPPDRDISPRLRVIAAPGLVAYSFAISFAVIDWVMSINAPWTSTIYCLIFVAAEGLSALCFIVVVEAILYKYPPMLNLLRPKEVHDHGKLILAATMLWAYFAFSQLLIIWAGDLTEEISWYLRRLYNGWEWIGLALAVFHFIVPFMLLLSRPFKRRVESLALLAAWMLVMCYLDIFWFIEPSYHKSISVSWQDVVVPIAMGGIWMAFYFYNLKQRPLLPLHDPHIHELFEVKTL